MGHSFGGLFTLYALFAEPDLFNKYIAGSPAWAWDHGSLYTFSDKIKNAKLSHPVKLYTFMGEYEDVPGFEKLEAAIKNFQVKELTVETRVIQGSGHAGTKPEGYNRGLQYVFARPCLSMDPKILEKYSGEYEFGPQFVAKLVADNGKLVAILPTGEKIPVCAESEKDFYVAGSYLNVHFVADKQGNITGFRLERYNNESFAKKIK